MKTITLQIRQDDAEPILRQAAMDAAKFGAWLDYITRKTVNQPSAWGNTFEDRRKEWQEHFLKAKRMVEAFGLEVEPTSEGETLEVYIPMKNEKRKLKVIAGLAFNEVSGGEPDYAHPLPSWRRSVHEEACRQAADRVVRRWRDVGG
jgi:hypothetical protein